MEAFCRILLHYSISLSETCAWNGSSEMSRCFSLRKQSAP